MRAVIQHKPARDEREQVGWIEVDEDLNVEWKLEEDHPRSHELQKEIHALEHGHKDVVPVGYRGMEELEEPYPSENPTPEDFFRQLRKNFDEYSHSMVEEYEKVLLIKNDW